MSETDCECGEYDSKEKRATTGLAAMGRARDLVEGRVSCEEGYENEEDPLKLKLSCEEKH